MIRKTHSFYYLAFFLSISLLLWFGYQFDNQKNTQLSAILSSNELRVSTTNSEDTYYLDKNSPAGFEYDLINAFAQELGVRLKLTIRQTPQQLTNDLISRDSHISVLGRSQTFPINNSIVNSKPYSTSQTVVIYRETQGKKYPRGIRNILNRSVILPANSIQESQMLAQQKSFPDLSWSSTQNFTTYEILEQVFEKQIDIAIISQSEFEAIGSFFPGLKVGFKLDKPIDLNWELAKKADHSLLYKLNAFFSSAKTKQLIIDLEKKYYTNSNPLNFFDTVTFKKDFNTRLPDLEPYFKQAAKETDIDWILLASIAYQESHWNPKAVSSTGVKGIMMLTKAAAKEVNVTNRVDPKQSIFGGAQYLRNVKSKIPTRITEPDRTFLALAGYNSGFGHLEDARILTKRAGLNPDSWKDVSTRFPLLTKPKYYNTVKHGYARGYEPVNYVRNIKKYLTILRWEKEQHILKEEAVPTPSPTPIEQKPEKTNEEQTAPSTL